MTRLAIIDSAARILLGSIEAFAPDYIISMVSGGKDSLASDAVLREIVGRPDAVIHGNTRCGIAETTDWVRKNHATENYLEADAGTAYRDYVLRKGFFGKGRDAHGFAYRILKAGPFRKVVSREFRKRRRGVKILLINGARRSESANRMANLQAVRADPGAPGNLWVSPLLHWTDADRDEYIASRGLCVNPVAQALCRSGECMCGTMQTDAERVEAAALYPAWGRMIDDLEAEARDLHGFGWGQNAPRPVDPRQGNLFTPMCVDCGVRP